MIYTNKTYLMYIGINLAQRFISSYDKLKALKYAYVVRFSINKNLFKLTSKWALEIRFIFNNIIWNIYYEKEKKYG